MWSVQLEDDFKSYDPTASAAIERSYQQREQSCSVVEGGNHYTILFAEMKQCSAKDSTKSWKVQRTEETVAQNGNAMLLRWLVGVISCSCCCAPQRHRTPEEEEERRRRKRRRVTVAWLGQVSPARHHTLAGMHSPQDPQMPYKP